MNIPGKPRSKLLLFASHVFSDASRVSPSDYLSGVDGHSIHYPSRLSTDWSTTGLCNVAHAMRPQILMEKLQLWLLTLEGKLRDNLDTGIIHQSDANFTARIKANMGRWVWVSFHEIIHLPWPWQTSIQDLRAPREDTFDVGGNSTRDKGCLEGSLIRD